MRQPGDALPNQFPVVEPPGTARIALVGGAPSRDDDWHGSLLTGQPGAILDGALERCGLTRSQMFLGSVCRHRAPGDDFNRLAWDGAEVQVGIRQLRADLEKFRPSIVVCLGQEALHLFKRGNTAPARARGCFDWPDRIGDWRGSLFASDFLSGGERQATAEVTALPEARGITPPLKCLAAFHPSFVAKDYSQQAYYRCAPGIGDFERLRVEAGSAELRLPLRHIDVLFDRQPVLNRLEKMRLEKKPVAVDIEGGTNGITSIAFSRNAETATVVPLARLSFARMWSKEDEGVIWSAVKALLEDPGILKIAHNAAYDGFCLEWAQGIRMVNVQDTMEQWWELFAELKKGLATLTSLLTRQPFYKPDKEEGEMKFSSDQEFWNYNGLDAVVTMECWERVSEMLTGSGLKSTEQGRNALNTGTTCKPSGQHQHFLFNSSLFAPKLRMMLRGIRVDQSKLEELKAEAAAGVWRLQALIDQEAASTGSSKDLFDLYHSLPATDLGEEVLAEIVLRCLGGSNPRVRRDVTVERWQPMRWKAGRKGRWIKAGKLINEPVVSGCPVTVYGDDTPPPADEPEMLWLKPAHKTVSRLQSFTPSALAEVEPHVLDSKRAEWRRVKQIWKELSRPAAISGSNVAQSDAGQENRRNQTGLVERKELKNERNTDKIQRDGDGDSSDQRGRETEIHGGESGVDGGGSALGGETEVKATADGSTSTSDCKRTRLAGESALLEGGDPGETPQSKEMVSSRDGKVGQCSAALLGKLSGATKATQTKELKNDPAANHSNLERNNATLGELSTLLGLAVNAGSTSEGGDSQWFLYEVCRLPRMYCDARTGRYSRETETEWRKRTKEGGVRHARKQRRKTAKEAGPVVETSDDAEGLGAGGQGGDAGGMDTVPEGNPAGESAKSSKKISTDQIALVRLYAHSKDVRLLWVLQQRRLRKVVTDLSTKLDPDGRLRASISLVKETGRMSESAAPTGCGLNRQALNKDLLSICIPDEGYEMAKLDLEGADSWTVACEAASLGDETMLEDLRAGLKPAKVICLLYHEGLHVNGMFRDEIRDHCERMKFPAWLYPAAKACCHGSSYAMGWETMQMTLLKNSMADLPLDLKDSKPIVLSKKQIDDLQGAFFSRYPGVRKWQQKVGRQLMEKGYLQTSTGHVRRFYGRKIEISKGRKVVNHETWKEALASMAQYYTTWSIKQAWLKMWEDEENWRICRQCHGVGEVRLFNQQTGNNHCCNACAGYARLQIVEPLALKHDEILMQWRKEDREWALKKLPEWFRTPVRIAGIEVVIPAAGKIGCNWSMKEGETIKPC